MRFTDLFIRRPVLARPCSAAAALQCTPPLAPREPPSARPSLPAHAGSRQLTQRESKRKLKKLKKKLVKKQQTGGAGSAGERAAQQGPGTQQQQQQQEAFLNIYGADVSTAQRFANFAHPVPSCSSRA